MRVVTVFSFVMPEKSLGRRQLVQSIVRVLDAYCENPQPDPEAARRHSQRHEGTFFNSSEERMYDLIKQEMPGWLKVARAVASNNSYSEMNRIPQGAARYRLARQLAELADSRLDISDNHSIAETIVGYLVGPAFPIWECVLLDIKLRDRIVPLFAGWELCNNRHPSMQELFPGHYFENSIPPYWENAGVLRRPVQSCDHSLACVPHGDRELTWPMILLNLVSGAEIRAIQAYRLEPERSIVRTTIAGSFSTHYVPAEVRLWDQNADPKKYFNTSYSSLNEISDDESFAVSAVIAALAHQLFSLDARRRDSFSRAADRYMAVAYLSSQARETYERNPGLAKMPPGEATAQLAAAIELLLIGEDSDKMDLTRKVSQRAAVLVGLDDDERLAIQDLARVMYRARSAHVHGGSETSVELPQIQGLARKVMTSWLILSPRLNRGQLPELLDKALLSREHLSRNVTTPIEAFWTGVGTVPERFL